MYYFVDIVETTRAVDEKSRKKLKTFNKHHLEMEKTQASFEENYNKIDQRLLTE